MERDDDIDRRLADLFAGEPAPAPPAGLEGRVRTLIRRRKRLRRATAVVSTAAVLGFAAFASWELWQRPASGPQPIVQAPTQPAKPPSDDLADLLPLFEPPPVAVVVPGQKRELAALNQMSEGGRK